MVLRRDRGTIDEDADAICAGLDDLMALTDAPDDPERVATAPWHVLTAVGVGLFLVNLDATVLFVAFPDMRESFPEVTSAKLSWAINGYTIVFAALLVPAGRVADRVGRAVIFERSLVIFIAASVAASAAPGADFLIGARILQAVGAAGMIPSSLGLVLHAYPVERRTVAVALWSAIGASAAALGPAIGAAAVELAGWRAAFLINVPIGAIGAVRCRQVLRDRAGNRNEPFPSPVGALLLAVGVALITMTLVQSGEWGWVDARSWSAVIAGAMLIGVFVAQSLRSRSPAIDLTLFSVGSFRLAIASILVFQVGMGAMMFGWILFMIQVWDWSIVEAGLAVTPMPLLVTFAAPFAGRALGWLSFRTLLIPGGLIYALGASWMLIFASDDASYLTVLLPALLITGTGTSIILPLINGAAMHSLPPDRFAVGAGISQAMRQIGMAFGVALAVSFVGTGTDSLARFDRAWTVQMIGGLSVAILSTRLVVKPRTALPADEPKAAARPPLRPESTR